MKTMCLGSVKKLHIKEPLNWTDVSRVKIN